jgi:hypothetical protein
MVGSGSGGLLYPYVVRGYRKSTSPAQEGLFGHRAAGSTVGLLRLRQESPLQMGGSTTRRGLEYGKAGMKTGKFQHRVARTRVNGCKLPKLGCLQ